MYKIISLNQSSWEQAIKNRFKNLRRGKRPSNNETCKPGTSSQSKWIKKKDQPTSNSSGETDETVKEHCSTMKKELSKTSNKNLVLVRELMNATFEARRIQIMNNPTTIEATLKIYPALKLVSEVHVIHPLYTAVEHNPMQTHGMLLDSPKAHVFVTSLFSSLAASHVFGSHSPNTENNLVSLK